MIEISVLQSLSNDRCDWLQAKNHCLRVTQNPVVRTSCLERLRDGPPRCRLGSHLQRSSIMNAIRYLPFVGRPLIGLDAAPEMTAIRP